MVAGSLVEADAAQVLADRALVGMSLDGLPDFVLGVFEDHLADQLLPLADASQQGHGLDPPEKRNKPGLFLNLEGSHVAVHDTCEQNREAAVPAILREVRDLRVPSLQSLLKQFAQSVEQDGDALDASDLAQVLDGLLELVAQQARFRDEVFQPLGEERAVQGASDGVVEVLTGVGLRKDDQPTPALAAQSSERSHQLDVLQAITQATERLTREGAG